MTRTITEADVAAFAALTGDRHPVHLDSDWAASSQFGERIAHGLLVLSSAVGLAGFDPARVVALRRVRDVVFKRPVRLGDSIRVQGERGEARTVGDGVDLLPIDLTVFNQRDEVVLRAAVEVLWRREADSDPHEGLAERLECVPL